MSRCFTYVLLLMCVDSSRPQHQATRSCRAAADTSATPLGGSPGHRPVQ